MSSSFCESALAGTNFWVNLGAGSSFFFWIAAYLTFALRNYSARTWTIPPLAICLNFSWEFLFTFIFPNREDMAKTILYLIWFAVDVLLVVQLYRYGRKGQPPVFQNHYKLKLTFVFLAGIFFEYYYTLYYGDRTGTELAYLINLVMSFEFIRVFAYYETDLKKFSYAGAWFKFIGTVLSMPGVYFAFPCVEPRAKGFTWIAVLFILIIVLDIYYIVLVRKRLLQAQQKPTILDFYPDLKNWIRHIGKGFSAKASSE